MQRVFAGEISKMRVKIIQKIIVHEQLFISESIYDLDIKEIEKLKKAHENSKVITIIESEE